MKIIINVCYGGYGINEAIAEKLNIDNYEKARYNKELIKMIESGIDCGDGCSELEVVNVPDDATDFEIYEYDGCESIIYVQNGKLHHL